MKLTIRPAMLFVGTLVAAAMIVASKLGVAPR